MGAKLRYAKVVDKERFYIRGGRVHPGLANEVVLRDDRAAAAFLVLRAWSDDRGTFTEQWRIEGPGGRTLYEGSPRELHLATRGHVERLEDEVDGVRFDDRGDDHVVVFVLDDNEVARVRFALADGNPPNA